jgi:hypothetical protein
MTLISESASNSLSKKGWQLSLSVGVGLFAGGAHLTAAVI